MTLNCETENTRFSGLTSRSSLREMYEEDLHQDAVQAMCDAWQVTIIDPEWGRNDVLWPMLGHGDVPRLIPCPGQCLQGPVASEPGHVVPDLVQARRVDLPDHSGPVDENHVCPVPRSL